MWGPEPYTVAVIHGGPGAPGEMAPVARELSTITGVLEPFQTEKTLEGQVQELRQVLSQNGRTPLVLIGFSWGAFLSWILAARYPELVKKLVLVSSGPFEDAYAQGIIPTRLERLSPQERAEAQGLLDRLGDPGAAGKDATLAQLGVVLARSDTYDAAMVCDEGFHCQYEVFRGVWDEAAELRRKRHLIMLARKITCPVLAIHGDYDPHPAEGVREPLSRELADFRFVLLEKCGHRPWVERHASELFYKTLVAEIRGGGEGNPSRLEFL